MKLYLKLLLAGTVLMLCMGCEKGDSIEFEDALLHKSNAKETITMGFNLVFTGVYTDQHFGNLKCGDENNPYLFVQNQGEGTGTHFGKVKSFFEFCVDVEDFSYPNEYEEGYFEDEEGDRLFIAVEGFVIPGRVPGMPSYATSYFKDPFTILGGTGKFEDATGNGFTNDYNSLKDPYSHHHWTGKITLKKKNSVY